MNFDKKMIENKNLIPNKIGIENKNLIPNKIGIENKSLIPNKIGIENKSLIPNKIGIGNINNIFIYVLIVIIICIIIYLIICFVHYYNITCFEKKNFFKYLFDFSENNVCIKEEPLEQQIEKPVEKPVEFPKIDIPFIENKEVFHIANQDYTYEQSKCKCESYGSRLATKTEIIDAYNNGASWCTYGWTENQSAYYPVQQCEWDKINKENERIPKNSKKYCGIPGINGGHFSNPSLKFGINCFGVKPKGHISKEKKPYCPPMNFCKLPNNFNASHKLPDDEIVGFNNDKWNE